MNTLTHALLPVVVVAADQNQVNSEGAPYWNKKKLWLVGLFGALPDLLTPHLSLQARYTSVSHGLPAMAVLAMALLLLMFVRRWSFGTVLFGWMFMAYGLHLFCDLIAGGIAWGYPIHASVVGGYYVPPILWIPLDVTCCVTVYLVHRAIPNYLRWSQRKKRGVSCSD